MAQKVVFPQIAAESLRDKVIAALKESFFAGVLKPGEPIVERHISQQMGVGTPAVREALVTLQEQGFVRRVANTATYVNKFSAAEVEQLYRLRVEMEVLALQWAKPRATDEDLKELEQIVEQISAAAAAGRAPDFYDRDLAFHRRCWALCGNKYLAEHLERLVAPLFAFVLNGNQETVRVSIAKEHLTIVNALRNLQDPQFTATVRKALSGFATQGIASMVEESGNSR